MEQQALARAVASLCADVGSDLVRCYQQHLVEPIEQHTKNDNSPVTAADQLAHRRLAVVGASWPGVSPERTVLAVVDFRPSLA